MKEKKTIKSGETITINMKSCSFCNNGNCKNTGFRASLNDFKDITYCKYTMLSIQFTKI